MKYEEYLEWLDNPNRNLNHEEEIERAINNIPLGDIDLKDYTKTLWLNRVVEEALDYEYYKSKYHCKLKPIQLDKVLYINKQGIDIFELFDTLNGYQLDSAINNVHLFTLLVDTLKVDKDIIRRLVEDYDYHKDNFFKEIMERVYMNNAQPFSESYDLESLIEYTEENLRCIQKAKTFGINYEQLLDPNLTKYECEIKYYQALFNIDEQLPEYQEIMMYKDSLMSINYNALLNSLLHKTLDGYGNHTPYVHILENITQLCFKKYGIPDEYVDKQHSDILTWVERIRQYQRLTVNKAKDLELI